MTTISNAWAKWVTLALAACLVSTSAEAATFTVNEVGFDSGDLDLSDGQCAATGTGTVCTLRAAIEQANVLPGTDTIILPARAEHYPVNLIRATEFEVFYLPLQVFDSVNLVGEGAEQSIVDGMGTNPILWVQTAEALVLDVGAQTADQGFVMRKPYDGSRHPAQLVDTGRLNWDSRVRIVGEDLLVTSRDGGVLRYVEATGEFLGYAVPPTLEGAFLDVSDVSLGPDGLLYAARRNGGEVMRFEYPAGTLVDVFVAGGSFDSRGLRWQRFAGGVDGLLVTRFDDSTIRRYDTAGNLVASIETGFEDVADIAVKGTDIFVATGSDNSVHRFDRETGADLGSVVAPGAGGLDYALSLAFGPNQHLVGEFRELFVTSSATNQVLRYDMTNGKFVGVFAQGDTPEFDTVGAVVFRVWGTGTLGPNVTVQNLTLANGFEPHRFGAPSAGLYMHGGTDVTLSDCSIRDVASRVFGGGIANHGGSLTVRRCSILNNTLPTGDGGQTSTGGGIFNRGVLTIEDSLIAGNRAGKGGGIAQWGYLGDAPQATIVNTTIAMNESDGEGGGVRVVLGNARISFSTIARNVTATGGNESRPFGGGIFVEDNGFVMLGGTIVAENTLAAGAMPNDCYAPDPLLLISQRDNLFGVLEDDCQARDGITGGLDGILFGTELDPLDPGLSDALADYGGPTDSFLLEPGSPAIDADLAEPLVSGDPFFACGDHDQRQLSRPIDGDADGELRCDIGAVEVSAALASDLDGDGIENDLDLSPSEFSFLFSNESFGGSSSGEIVSAGAQRLSVTIGPGGGIIVSAAPGGGDEPALIVACGGDLIELAAGESTTISCASADAGPDQTIECGEGGALVTLDGSGSSAGGATTYDWSAPGVLLSNANQVVATGTFPLGTTTASLTVAVGSTIATDTALITVTDVTPPVLNIPANIVAKTCGSVALGQASAVDICGGTVTVSNNAPASFSAGVHVVTWTATDVRGNTTQKQQTVVVGLGNSAACCPAGTNVIVGNSNNNTLTGTAGRDCIVGMGGQDTINGLGGNDVIAGGDGDDVLDGGSGDDFIDGGPGQDILRGKAGADTLFGSDGDDQCYGGDQADLLHGGLGQDQLYGENGNDALNGDDGDDNLLGGNDDDALNGGGLHDQCDGQAGSNSYLSCDNQPSSAGPLTASFAISDDWGSGYCVDLTLTNANATDASNIAVVFNLPDGTIFSQWNGVSNGARGVVTMIPSKSFNQSLYPGEVDASLGFCVTRDNPWSGAPTVMTTSATLE